MKSTTVFCLAFLFFGTCFASKIPTYDEIMGQIEENERLLQKLDDFFKNRKSISESISGFEFITENAYGKLDEFSPIFENLLKKLEQRVDNLDVEDLIKESTQKCESQVEIFKKLYKPLMDKLKQCAKVRQEFLEKFQDRVAENLSNLFKLGLDYYKIMNRNLRHRKLANDCRKNGAPEFECFSPIQVEITDVREEKIPKLQEDSESFLTASKRLYKDIGENPCTKINVFSSINDVTYFVGQIKRDCRLDL